MARTTPLAVRDSVPSRVASRRTALLLAPGMLVLALAGCSGGSSSADVAGGSSAASASPTASVAQAALVAQIGSQLEAQKVKTDADSLTCPGGLPAGTGQSITCRFTTDSQPVDAVATVTAVQSGSVSFDVTAKARPVAQDLLVQKVGEELGDAAEGAVDDVSCAAGLPADVGGSTTCTAKVGNIKGSFQVTVTGIDGGRISYSIDNG